MKLFKKILKITGFVLAALLVLSVSLSFMFSKQIGNRILAEVKKELVTKMEVKDFNIELFSGFPNASLNFEDVRIEDIHGQNLLESKKIAFRFGLLSLFQNNIDVKSILIDDGALLISYDKQGRPNYEIFRESKGEKKTSSSKGLSIREAILSDIELIYENQHTKQEGQATIDKATFSGLFSATKFKMDSQANLKVGFLETENERYLAGTDISYDAKILVDLEKGSYEFKHFNLFLADSKFDVEGDIQAKEKYTDFDLAIEGKEGSLSSVFQLLSEEKQASLDGIKTKGDFYFDGTIKGRLTPNKNPDVHFKFGIKKGEIYGDKLAESIEDFSFTGKFTSVRKKSRLDIENVKGYVDNNSFSGGLTVKNMDDPFIDCFFKGALPISLVYGFAGGDPDAQGTGQLKVKDFSMLGYYKHMIDPRKVGQVKIDGKIVIDDAGVLINGQEIVVDKGTIQFNQNKLNLNHIKIDGIGQEVRMDGYVKNFVPVIFADSVNSQHARLDFLLNVEAKELDLKAIMSALVPETEENKKVESEEQEDIDLSFASYLNGEFNATIDEFSYGKIEGQNFEGKVSFEGVEVSLTGDAEAMGGDFGIEGMGYLVKKPTLKTFLVFDNVDVKEFFRQTDNLGQDFLTYKSLVGRLDSRMIIESFWNEKGIFDEKKLTALSEMKIHNGELINFSMMDNFASFIKVQDLRHIKFTELENWMEVKKGKVYIPTMFIQSNAANLLVAGQHSFEQKISYYIKVNAGQIIARKFKRHNPKLTPQRAKKGGWLNLFYTIKGTTEDFDYRMDKRGVKKAFAREENRKRRIRRVLNKEFGTSKTASIARRSTSDLTPVDLDSSEDFLPTITPNQAVEEPTSPKIELTPKPKTETNTHKPRPEGQKAESEYMEFDEEL